MQKVYSVKLRGTKKQGTEDIVVHFTNCRSKRSVFNFAYYFFEEGDVNKIYGNDINGKSDISHWLVDAEKLKHLAGKYKVHYTSITCL